MISTESIKHIAKLSRLSFSETEIEQFTEQLGAILNYVDQLAELDTTGVKPASHCFAFYQCFSR